MQVNRVSYQNNVFIGIFINDHGERGEGGGREEHTMETGIVSQEWSLWVTGHFKNLSKLQFILLMHVNQFLCLEKKRVGVTNTDVTRTEIIA